LDEQHPRDIFFFEMDGSYVIRISHAGQGGLRQELVEFTPTDIADLIARGAERVSREDLDAATRAVADWAVEQLTPAAASELMGRLRSMLAAQPASPTLVAALRIARQNGWDRRVVQGLVNVLADAMERPE
ncbi:hypothetical protein, partial [Acinetobacter baumannii]|uniref:hypothetical protein n=1 Tax=Acinetobacter baumannii TaxID=470 RepID=UPI003393AE0D